MNYSIVYGEIIFLNDNKYFYAYLYWGKCPLGHIRPSWQKHYTIFFSNLFYFFFHFRCILLQISHQKCFFISISIPGRSGVNDLPSCVNSKVRLFADDCLLYREIKNNQDQIDMQRDLDARSNGLGSGSLISRIL